MTRFVLGFVFDPTFKRVVLIKKERPDWQVGAWNGVGGKVNEGETSLQAVRRECEEETGLFITTWRYYVTEYFPDGKLDVFWAFSNVALEAETRTDEEVAVWPVSEVLGGVHLLVKDVAHYVDLALQCREAAED